MRDVDQATGKDLTPMGKDGQGLSQGPQIGLKGLSGVHVKEENPLEENRRCEGHTRSSVAPLLSRADDPAVLTQAR